MEKKLQDKVDLFIETFNTLKKQYIWSIGDLTKRFIALIYNLSNKPFNKNEFDDMVKYIKDNTGVFSHYRGHQIYSIAALLITKFDNPKESFDKLLKYDEKMKLEGFRKNSYLTIASYALLLTCDSNDVDSRIERAMEIYKDMKSNHFWLTGSDDYPIAVLLAEKSENKDILISEIEHNYDALNNEGFRKSNGLQFLSHLLTFASDKTVQIKAHQTKNTYDRLKEEKFHVSATYYGVLGFLSILGDYGDKAVEEVIEVSRYLKSSKGFKWTAKDMNVLAATAIVSNQYIEKLSQSNELIEAGIGISIETMIAAQTAAIIAATSAATASSAAAASGGS